MQRKPYALSGCALSNSLNGYLPHSEYVPRTIIRHIVTHHRVITRENSRYPAKHCIIWRQQKLLH